MEVLGISFGNSEGGANFSWKKKLVRMNVKLGLWRKRNLTITGKILAIKVDILPAFLHLAYIFPIPQLFRKQSNQGSF